MGEAARRRVVRALRRRAMKPMRLSERAEGGSAPDVGMRLREALPRALMAPCLPTPAAHLGRFSDPAAAWDAYRQHAHALLADALAAEGTEAELTAAGWDQGWGKNDAEAPLFQALDSVLDRKRVACAGKLRQLDAVLSATRGLKLDGSPQSLDILSIFRIEKQDHSYLPRSQDWFRPREW